MNIVELTAQATPTEGERPSAEGIPWGTPNMFLHRLKMSVACANVAYSTENFRWMVASDPAFAFMSWSGIFRPDKARQDKTGEG